MENASKALLMAAGVLIGVLLLSLMVTLFVSASSLSRTYDESKNSESIQQFNANFTKYIRNDLTIHEVITIYNFAKENGVTVTKDGSFDFDNSQIAEDLQKANEKYKASYSASKDPIKVLVLYSMKVTDYDGDGYIAGVHFYNRRIDDIEIKED